MVPENESRRQALKRASAFIVPTIMSLKTSEIQARVSDYQTTQKSITLINPKKRPKRIVTKKPKKIKRSIIKRRKIKPKRIKKGE